MTIDKLAIDGGTPVRTTPLAPWPFSRRTKYLLPQHAFLPARSITGPGTEGREFEKEFAAYTGCSHAIALANGTVALELALYALGIGHGDEVITTCRTFIASASCIVMRGATPVIADVDPVSQNITAKRSARTSPPAQRPSSVCIWPAGRATWIRSWNLPRAWPKGDRGLRPGTWCNL